MTTKMPFRIDNSRSNRYDNSLVWPDSRGFTLIELLITTLVLSVILGSVLALSNQGQGRKEFQEDLLAVQQGLREATDQMYRDMRMGGYPQPSIFDIATGWTAANSNRIALGFRSINSTDLQFEGDIDNDGIVEVVEYSLNGTTLQRSEVEKNADGSVPSPNFQILAENVTNLNFTYYTWTGGAWSTAGVTLSNVKRVDISLTLRTSVMDPARLQYANLTMQISVIPRNLE
ncbi:MAG TPA: prepilin-type N-terminal cleavage/methylation domain-containing protein [Terriglobia bacterium]|nr:prepilin-type N-terminal cleavage/methylation domain-containing protein [Terriglobia bacterium]